MSDSVKHSGMDLLAFAGIHSVVHFAQSGFQGDVICGLDGGETSVDSRVSKRALPRRRAL